MGSNNGFGRPLFYSFSGELDEIAHLFPSERLATLAAISLARGADALVLDRSNFTDLTRFGAGFMRRLGDMSFDEKDDGYMQVVRGEADAILSGKPDILFVNLWQGTGFKFSADLARLLRGLAPDLPVYGIGQKVDWFTGHILELAGDAFDGLVAGLGYGAVRRLLAGDAPESVPGLIRRNKGVVVSDQPPLTNVDDFPAPAYSEDVYRHIDRKVPIYELSLSNQACPNRCVYCVRPENYGRRLLKRDVAGVVREAVHMFERGITHFRVIDSTPPRRALTELARGLIDAGLEGKIALCGFSRADVAGCEDFTLLRKAGFVSLFFGIEALDDERLLALRKGITFDQVRSTLERVHSAGIRTVGSLIFPTPGETQETMDNTLERLAMLRPVLDSALVLASGVYPPTEWGRHPEKFGIRLAPDYVRQGIIYPVKYLVPMRHWHPLPYSYELMGKPARDVKFTDIVGTLERFVEKIRKDMGYPGVPDYYYLIAHLLGRDPAETTGAIVKCIVERNYAGLDAMFGKAPAGKG
ncbi:MAG: radical SAM protein [Lentisphaerae bacterium]|nr:radical SAM protein [Lentisphaerota bacterium]